MACRHSPGALAIRGVRASITSSSALVTRRSITSRLLTPAAATTWSLSVITTGEQPFLWSTSAYCPANWDSSPMGEYFLKITSPSALVKISSGSPSLMRNERRISLGITMRPKSSMRRTIPVAFIEHISLNVNISLLFCTCFARRYENFVPPFFPICGKKIPGCTAGGKGVCFLRFLTDEAQDQVCHSAAGAAVQVVKELGLKGRYFLALKVAGGDGLC